MRGSGWGQPAELFSNNLLIVPRGKFYNFNFALAMLLLLFFLFPFLSFCLLSSLVYGTHKR